MPRKFVHLRFHSEYSVTDGIVRLDPMLEEAVRRGDVALGLTDNMNIFGGLRFFTHALADGIKPILGCDIWITNDKKEANGDRGLPFRLTLYCMNHTGYLSLCNLLSKAWMENQYLGRGEFRFEWFTEENCRGLICLSGGPRGILERLYTGKTPEDGEVALKQLMAAFPGRLYLEVQRVGEFSEEIVVGRMAKLSIEKQLPLVATHPIQFMDKEDFEPHEVRVSIAQGYVMEDPRRPKLYTPEQYYKTEAEMRELFKDLPQAIENAAIVAQRCNLDGVLQKPQLPVFPTPDGMSLDDYMVKLSKEGLERRLEFLYADKAERDAKRPEYMERLDYELNTIIKMKFPGYFLIVQDFINWSKRNGVPVGPGRGSGAGSLVAYCLGITDLDPLHYGLLFERFLNPERVSMPDFDVDFCQHNRDRTIEYVKRAYGKEAVSQIVTFGAMGAKAVVRDVGRALNMGYGEVDALAKLIPQKPGMDITIDKALEMEPDFKAKSERPEYKRLMAYSRKLEGITRNLGMHAGGVLIAPGKLTDFCPLYNADGKPENTVSQYDKKDVENVGLVKFDFLGLTTLTILAKAVEYMDRLTPGKHFDLARIPVDDPETLKLFQEGNTGAVFQFESEGMRDQLRKAKPDCLEDLVALNALYRPGPMDQIPHFIDRKFGREEVKYLDQRMEPILRETYGIMVYQEQVMLVARAIGGYSLGGADLLRRAMGKKNVEEMKRQRAVFIKGAAERNVDEKTATDIFNLMEKFAGYGFNKSHAAAYSFVAWQTAYLKVHHPGPFFAGNLCLVMDQGEKMSVLINDAKECGVTFLPPDVNVSDWFFTVPDEHTIRMGMGSIKGMSQNIVEDILEERSVNGMFLDIFDLAARVPTVNRKVLEQLVRSGALDSLDSNRGKNFANIHQALQAAQTVKASVGQVSLFADENGEAERIVSWVQAPAWNEKQRLQGEIDAFGFCFTGNLFDYYRTELATFTTPLANVRDNRQAMTIAGMVLNARIIQGKRGRFAVVMIEDGKSTMDVLIYSEELLSRYRLALKAGEVIAFVGRGRFDEMRQKMSFLADEVMTLEDIRVRRGAVLKVSISTEEQLEEAMKLLTKNKTREGKGVPCLVDVGSEGIGGEIQLSFPVRATDALPEDLVAVADVAKASYGY